ncbi:lipoprotein-releasing system ATP-binding protein LolD [Psychrosphaera saromensis]|uniref:Lipoprotein-releasing system ATP-binding protein LolD n=1 Tax=Psychrosphaera saromensis TaxID=716813 RepID=A0A2S7UY03_9GAMM|nr:lipoprotein-releasing ABC transporter ATP-binding protein LolD [Psychrosphaera saromensis]PQJ54649.1 lipoprotein releasing system, ATP-binding protein [Psychrosphaera saromensis]GHB58304.1 lipoprotein-releasing system ATP-binding protein LolD [Psychrosphaera saromensis]GLQ14130.1 lipoprotein-releasing system ATP-binding protein LolD [Psychrosphaera saromensis]
MSEMKLVECQNVVKQYADVIDTKSKEHTVTTQVLKGVNLDIAQGEQIAILGQSGSGKSTLLHILGMLDNPSSGVVKILGQDVTSLNETERAAFRNENMGFIYQFHHLLMEFSAVENVAMPLLIKGVSNQEANKEATKLLELVGLSHRLNHNPSQLSGGERQRVAIARALVNKPKLVLADEPTGNLDKENAEHVFKLFMQLNQEFGTSLVVVTHDLELAARFNRVIKLDDGLIS